MTKRLVAMGAVLMAAVFVCPLALRAQTAPPVVAPPVFKDVRTPEDFAKLTPEEQQQARDFYAASEAALQPSSSSLPAGATNCFDDYRFGSVQASIEPTLMKTIPGVPLGFRGAVQNDNPYPVVDGRVYVKIFRKQTDASLAHQNGHFLVDAFVAKDGISLKGNGTLPLTFTWNVPGNAAGGDYEADTFFITSERFNLLGLSFTDDVVGNKADFRIDSASVPVAFDKNAVKLNDTQYRFAAFPPHFAKDTPVIVEMPLVNPGKEPKTLKLSYKLYNWDTQQESNLLDTQTETVTLKAKESRVVTYAATQARGAVSLVLAEARDGDARSLLFVRFVRDGIAESRLNFPGLASFPLQKGIPNALFSCLHSTNADIPNGELTVSLTDAAGHMIHRYTYQGAITGAMMGTRDAFTPTEDYGTVILTATLKNDGRVVDTVTETYDCRALVGKNCPRPATFPIPFGGADDTYGSAKTIIVALVVLLTLMSLALIGVRRFLAKRGKFPPMALLVFALLLSGMLLGGGKAEAKNIVSVIGMSVSFDNTVDVSKQFYKQVGGNINPDGSYYGYRGTLDNPAASIAYGADLVNADTGEGIADGSLIPFGTKVRVEVAPRQDTDIRWFGIGGAMDTPYGHWVGEAKPPVPASYTDGITCDLNDEPAPSTQTPGNIYYWAHNIFTPFSVAPYQVESDLLSVTGLSCVGFDCTVTAAPGNPVTAAVKFDGTYGYFYYRLRLKDQNKCFGNDTPLATAGKIYYTASGTFGDSSRVDIPAQTIAFNLTAVNGNHVPDKPVLTPATQSVAVGMPAGFTVSATDPDNDTVRYGLDWNDDGSVDAWYPTLDSVPSGLVPSGTEEHPAYTFLASGTHTVKALAQDEKGGQSVWSDPVTVDVIAAPTVDLKVNSSDGSISLKKGTTKTLTWVVTDATTCTASSGDGFTGGKSVTGGTEDLTVNTTSTDGLECTGPGGTASDSVQINAVCDPTIGFWGNCNCATEKKSRWDTSALCTQYEETSDCTAAEKNACRDFNYREVAP